jgi:DNA-binding transcriptional ArsR family regulator
VSATRASLDVTFAALADPTRLAVIRTLMKQPRRAGEVAELVAVSAPALSRHLRVLRRAGLILEDGIEADARVRVYRLNPAAFRPVGDWLADLEGLWTEQLNAFKTYAERGHRTGRNRV